jgi:hypothetical protein
MLRLVVCVVAVVGTSAPVWAQTVPDLRTLAMGPVPATPPFAVVASFDQQRSYRRPARPPVHVGARVFGLLDFERMTASQSFTTVVGTPRLLGFGAGVDLVNLAGRDLFFRAALSDQSKNGTRSDGAGESNGIGVTIAMVPIDLAVGWRFNHLTRTNQITPYVGGGAVLLHYAETTPSGSSTDNTIAWFPGFEGFAGVDLRLGSGLFVGPEVDFRSVPKAIGQGGVSQSFGETNLGGVVFRVRVGVAFGGR